jgi:exopolysaccharide production protein ExoQ
MNGSLPIAGTPGRAAEVPATRLRQGGGDALLVAGVVLWLVYTVSGLRLPWSPIVVSDADSGAAMRQLLFTATALLALRRLFITGSLGTVLVQHPGLTALGAFLLASTAFSSDPVLTFKRAVIFNFGLVSVLTIVHLVPRPVRLMQLVVLGVTATAAAVSVVGFFVFPKDAVSIAARPGLAGVSGHPNTLAPALVIGFLVSLGVARSPGAGGWLLRASQLALLVALYMTNSITSFVLLVSGVLIYLILTARPYRRGVLQLLLTSLVLLVLVVGMRTVKSSFFDAVDRDPSLSGRDALWSMVLHEGMKEPLFGRGYGAFWYEGRGREIVGTWNPRQAHHAYIDLFVDLGAIGLLFVLIVFGRALLTGWQRAGPEIGTRRRRAAASMIAVAVSLLGFYAFGESFLLKLDKLPMFCLLWFACLLDNRDENRLAEEFPETLSTAP